MIDDDTKKQMAEHAQAWIPVHAPGAPAVTRETAVNEQLMALDVFDLLGEVGRLEKERDEARMLHQDATIQAIDRGASYQEARAEATRLGEQLHGIRLIFADLSADCHRTFGGGYKLPAESEIFHHGMETVCKIVEAALARHDAEPTKAPKAPAADLRSDYLAAFLWLNEAGVPMLSADGKPATLGERISLVLASRDKWHAAAMKWEDALERGERGDLSKRLERLEPLRTVLRSWAWAELLADERIPDEAVLPLLRAFATVERDEAKAKEAGR